MKKGDHRRNSAEVELDKSFSIRLWRQGYNIRDIAELLTEEHDRIGNPYKVSYGIIQRDIAEIIIEANKLRSKSGIDDLNIILDRLEFLYDENLQSHRIRPNPGYTANAAKILEQLAKLKGLQIDKTEVLIKYDIDIE
jgi:DNA-binding transcriptional MerR regulator